MLENAGVRFAETLPHPLGTLGNMSTHLDDPPHDVSAAAVRHTQHLERSLRRAEAAMIEHLDLVDRRGVYRDEGHRTIRAFQMGCAHVSRSLARDRWLTVVLCRLAPQVLEGLNRGELGVEQVRLLARTAARPRVGRLLTTDPDMFDLLLEYARTLSYAEFERVVQHWVHRADTDGTEPDHRGAHEERNTTITVSGDRVIIRTVLPATMGAQVEAIHNVFTQAEFDHDAAHATSPGGLARTSAQRRADAFVTMCLHALGPQGSITVDVGIVMDAATFDAAVTRQPVPHDAAGVPGRCHTLTGIPLHPTDAATAALWGNIHRAVIDAAGTTIDLGRTSRVFTNAARKAAHTRGTWCEIPGCDHPVAHIDHLHPWSLGGPTNQANAAVLCPFHNRWKARTNTTITRRPNGQLLITRADGTERITI